MSSCKRTVSAPMSAEGMGATMDQLERLLKKDREGVVAVVAINPHMLLLGMRGSEQLGPPDVVDPASGARQD